LLAFHLGSASAQDSPRFAIEAYTVDGNTLIPAADVDALLAPFTGPQSDFGDIQRALEALQEAYRERGYSAVRVLVPEQDIRAGQVRLQVIEAKVRVVRVEGNKFFDEANIRASIPSLTTGGTPSTPSIGRDIQLANENPAKQVSVALESAGQPGEINAVIRARDNDPQRFSISVDNTGNPQTGNARIGFGYQHANVFDSDHVFTGQIITAPDNVNGVAIFGVGYRIPLYGYNSIIDVFAGYSDVDSGTVSGLFNVAGKGTIFGARYTYMLPRLQGYEHRAVFGLDYRDYNNSVALVNTSGGIVPDYVVSPWSLGYTGKWTRAAGDVGIYATFSQNIPGGADGSAAALNAQRFGANPRYEIYRYGASGQQLFGNDMLARAVFNGQYTSNALVPGEQFGMGGWNSVRGFYEREVANDIGNQASFELYGPDFGAVLNEKWRARVLGFYDWAHGYDNSPIRSPNNRLGSVGLGIRMTKGRDFSLRVDFARVTDGTGSRPAGSNRVQAGAVFGF
jgi:hemolysin activation/secretion protein